MVPQPFIKHCQSDKTAAPGYSGTGASPPPRSRGHFSISCADLFSKEITSGSLDRMSWNSPDGVIAHLYSPVCLKAIGCLSVLFL